MKTIALSLLLLPALALAQVPTKVGYQGQLMKSDGSPEAGVVQLTFQIFGSASGGSALWTEQQSVGLADGMYAVVLGEVTSLPQDLFDGSERFLEVTVGSAPMSPRQKVVSVPYAFVSRGVAGGKVSASSVEVGGVSVIDSSGQIDWARIKGIPDNVSSVSVAAPLTGDGKSSSPVSLPAASGSADGYLARSDWSKFDGKLDAVLVSAPLTGTGKAGSPLSMAAATGSRDGFLTAADHAAFSAKLGSVATGAPLSGNGTAGSPISMAPASGSAPGYLTKEDWAKFDGKVSSVSAGAGIQVSGGQDATVAVKFGTEAGTAAVGNHSHGAPSGLNNLVLALELDETSGTTFADASGNGNVVTAPVAGIAIGSTGHTGKGVNFSGGVITASAPTRIPDSAQVWLEAWVQPALPMNLTRTIMTRPGSYSLKQVNSEVQFEVFGRAAPTTACVAASTGTALSAGNWAHVAAWYDGMAVSIAVNGVNRATVSCPNGAIVPTPSAPFHIGGVLSGTDVLTPYAGIVDEVRVRQTAPNFGQPPIFRKTQRIVGRCNDGRDSGYLDCRKLTFVKTRDDTTVRFTWFDNRRGIGYIWGNWEVMWNRKSCTTPAPTRYWHHSQSAPDQHNDNHYNSTITGVCSATADGPMKAGTYDIEILLTHHGGNNSDWHVGWDNTPFMIEAEEIY